MNKEKALKNQGLEFREDIIKEGGVKTMDNKQVNKAPQKSARLVLQAVTAIARSNANSLCRGLLYEPKVPTQLKK